MRALALPRRATRALLRRASLAVRRLQDRGRPAGIEDAEFARRLGIGDVASLPEGLLDLRPFQMGPVETVPGASAGYRVVAARAQKHIFDLLASGPVEVTYKTAARGAFGGKYGMAPGAHAEMAQRGRMRALLDRTAAFVGDSSPLLNRQRACLDTGVYRPIDWHLDFKSGYRWLPDSWYMDIRIGHARGADVKVPWELSRCHHLLALALDGITGGPKQEQAGEIGLEIVDWIAANPVRFGVNWRSAMDVAIRAANWVRAVAIAADELKPSRTLTWLIAKSLYEHGLHVAAHMDYEETGSNNHYLADIAGLLHIAAALPSAPESPYWTAWCVRELECEMRRTVTEDGASYEGSTGYHRLVTETFLHASALAVNLPADIRALAASPDPKLRGKLRPAGLQDAETGLKSPGVFPAWYWTRLRKMVEFTSEITSPNGLVPQFGDQDSARFLKFAWPARSDAATFVEEPRNHSHLVASGEPLAGKGLPGGHDSELLLEAAATRSLTAVTAIAAADKGSGLRRYVDGPSESLWHPGGGICIMKRGDFRVAVRCLTPSPDAPTGHMHADQFSFELNVAGIDFVVDPGTGVYTADPGLRNTLRAGLSHSGIEFIQNQARREATLVGHSGNLFTLPEFPAARCAVEANRFRGTCTFRGAQWTRIFTLGDSSLTVEDHLDRPRSHIATIVLAPDARALRQADGHTVLIERSAVKVVVSIEPGYQTIEIVDGLCSDAYGATAGNGCIVVRRNGSKGSFKIQRLADQSFSKRRPAFA